MFLLYYLNFLWKIYYLESILGIENLFLNLTDFILI